jgi:hypothetical protein
MDLARIQVCLLAGRKEIDQGVGKNFTKVESN